jgi:Cu+-exporting ATPase
LFVLRNNELIATVDMEDEIRPGAAALVAYLRAQGITPVLLSGDRQAVCTAVADKLGITSVYAEQLPGDKREVIRSLAAAGTVAMVGDGINDAPALAQAAVGISVGQATDVAMQAAQVVLLRDELELIAELHRISRHTVQTIRQNLFWAFFYNVMAIPLAAAGWLRPIIGTATMALSDVVVIGNSLRLRIKKLTP